MAVAMEVLDVSINALIARPGSCSLLISRIQSIGRFWDEHPEWAGRGWFIQILLAVAGLSRVVEWWEAEKGFWNFNDEEEQDAEPIRFSLGGQNGDAAAGEAVDQETGKASGFLLSATANSPTRARALSVAPADTNIIRRGSTSGTDSPASGLVQQEPEPSQSVVRRAVSPSKDLLRAAVRGDREGEDVDEDGDTTIVDRARPPTQRQSSAGPDSNVGATDVSETAQDEQMDDQAHDVSEDVDTSNDDINRASSQQPPQNFRSAGVNVLMELSMDDQRLLYLSPAWKAVLGSDPRSCTTHGLKICSLQATATSSLRRPDSSRRTNRTPWKLFSTPRRKKPAQLVFLLSIIDGWSERRERCGLLPGDGRQRHAHDGSSERQSFAFHVGVQSDRTA